MTVLLAYVGKGPLVSAQTCTAKPLSRKEAAQLLEVIPAAQYAKKVGGTISALDWSPGHDYRDDVFYFFVVFTSPPTGTPLENGLLGYFGVNKSTGEVIDLNEKVVHDPALKELQKRLRTKHCVSPDEVMKNQTIPLEGSNTR